MPYKMPSGSDVLWNYIMQVQLHLPFKQCSSIRFCGKAATVIQSQFSTIPVNEIAKQVFELTVQEKKKDVKCKHRVTSGYHKLPLPLRPYLVGPGPFSFPDHSVLPQLCLHHSATKPDNV